RRGRWTKRRLDRRSGEVQIRPRSAAVQGRRWLRLPDSAAGGCGAEVVWAWAESTNRKAAVPYARAGEGIGLERDGWRAGAVCVRSRPSEVRRIRGCELGLAHVRFRQR